LISFKAIFPSVWVVRGCQRETGARGRVLRNVNINLLRREAGWVVVDVLYFHLDHANFFVVCKHLHGELAPGVPLAQGFPVDPLLGVEETALGHPKVGLLALLPQLKSCILGNVSYHALNLLLWYGVVQVFQSQGLRPQEQERKDGVIHPFQRGLSNGYPMRFTLQTC
ncbi:hypothetical protein AMEX_G19104, partial [Astyanax mexicanus]